jgi:hypothetical protein
LFGTERRLVDIETGERVEGELDAMIRRRDEKRRQSDGERRLEALWVESVRRYQERQEADHRAAWHEYEMRLYRIHSGLAAEHLARAERLENEHEKGDAA